MRRKILTTFLILTIVMVVAFFGIANNAISETLEKQVTQSLFHELDFVTQLATLTEWDKSSAQSFVEALALKPEQRMTIIDAKGVVVADNYESIEKMDNHLRRPEIKDAEKADGYGVAIRYSETIKQRAIYVAVPFEKAGKQYFIRLSSPIVYLKEFNRLITQSTAIALAIVTLVIISITYFLAQWLTDPIKRLNADVIRIAEGAYGQPVYTAQTDEIGQLGNSFNQMRHSLLDAMASLETRNAELKAILNSMASGVIAVYKKREIMLINQSSREVLNLPDGIIGLRDSMYRIIRSDEIIEMINASIDKGQQQVREIYHIHLEKHLRVSIHPILTVDSDILGSMIVIEDISQIIKLENMRSEFVSNVSHELKTPLTSIMGFVDTLKNGALADREKAMRFLDIIETESIRLNRLISDILLLSEIENAYKEPEASEVILSEILAEVTNMLQIRLEKKMIELSYTCPDDISLNINRDRIKQMLINLIDNGIKYTEKGFVKIDVSVMGNAVQFVIEDSGIGIPEAHKARLFERFYRVDKARSRKVGGTGLGLSIVKHIVNQYRGDIQVESTIGVGSRFTVRIPIR